MRRYLFPVISGLLGVAILVSLGVWQLQRAAWKEELLAGIQAGIDADPVFLPAHVDPSMKYLPVYLRGTTTGEEILILSGTQTQAGYQVISGFVTEDGRRIMVDRGFLPQDLRTAPRPPATLVVDGNLHWPDEKTAATPEPNLTDNIWFAREVGRMAEVLGTEPVLVVARATAGETQGITPIPIGIEGIPNNHMNYALQWFMLAATWAGMTGVLIWRINRRSY